jgi:hypothetical protein
MYRSQLGAIYCLHPTLGLRLLLWAVVPWMSEGLWQKLVREEGCWARSFSDLSLYFCFLVDYPAVFVLEVDRWALLSNMTRSSSG